MPEGARRDVGGVPGTADMQARALIGAAIRKRREKAQMSQDEAAKALEIDVRTLRKWEAGTGSLWTGGDAGCTDQAQMSKLKDVYNAKISELMPRNQYPSAPLDPALRRDYFWRRNAVIQNQAPAMNSPEADEYVKAMEELRARAHGQPKPEEKKR